MLINFPNVLAVNESRADSPIQQIGERGLRREGALATFTRGRLHGFLFRPAGVDEVLILPNGRQIPDGYARGLQATVDVEADPLDLSDATWLRHPLMADAEATDREREIAHVLDSWVGAFTYVEEDPARAITGLRRPQIGAVHMVQGHWSVSNAPATIVMPTGTGKTETMLAVLIAAGCPKLLVVVPTDALRTQLAEKFLTLGILKSPACGVLSAAAKHPIVCTLQHIPRTVAEVDEVFCRSQVIVTTSSIAGQCEQAVQERMAHHCPYLFIDEAHHAEAPTWSAFKDRFRERRILQFTATPFREDGKPLDGDIIFTYPLRKAQEEGYFRPIRFEAVVEFNPTRSDAAIATSHRAAAGRC